MGDFNEKKGGGKKKGALPIPDVSVCQVCSRDTHKPGQGQLRMIVTNRQGKREERAAGELARWKNTVDMGRSVTDWSSVEWSRAGYEFVEWICRCNDCFNWHPVLQHSDDWSERQSGKMVESIGKIRDTNEAQRQEIRASMNTSDITPKTTQKAYRIIQQLIAPALMGSCKASQQQRVYAAKVVLWHWPQASNEPMPENIKALCHELVAA